MEHQQDPERRSPPSDLKIYLIFFGVSVGAIALMLGFTELLERL